MSNIVAKNHSGETYSKKRSKLSGFMRIHYILQVPWLFLFR